MAKKPQAPDAVAELRKSLQVGNIQPCYVFWGEETYLLHHYMEMLQKKVVDPLTEEFNYHRFSSENFSLDELSVSLENLPMMAERTMVRVDDVDIFKLREDERERLIGLLSDLPEYCTLVFVYAASDFKPDKRQKKLYDVLSKNASLVEFPKQGGRELTSWIIRHFRPLHKTISPELCNYLIEITGGTMTALEGEISKIAAFAPGEEIRRSDIDAVVEPVLDAVVFQMTDLLGAGDYEGALRKLQTLYKMQQEPIVILGAVGAHLRKISAARILMDAGRGGDDLMKLCSMGDYPARKTMAGAKRFSSRFCKRAAELVLETDRKLKTSFDEPERLLELCLMELAQEARNG